MNTTTWTTVDIPAEPNACIVLIKNISTETKEATIKDFFSFCGVIKAFEMKLDEQDGQHQIAIVIFEKESAAKTATLLSQAVVDDSPIEVEPFFVKVNAEPINSNTANKEINDNAQQQQQQRQESKSVSHVMAELLASGYVLTESVINKGAEFDNKHGVSTTVNGYLNKMGINLAQLNQRFYTSSTAKSNPETVTDDSNHAQQTRSATATSTTDTPTSNSSSGGSSRIQNLLGSKAGLKVQGIASRVADRVTNVHEEAKRIAAEKKSNNNTTLDHKSS